MNDMTHPNSAARLSDDIGDVLSAIRRLIAEDETMTEAEQVPEQPEKIAVGGEYLAGRHGGNAALARRITGDSQSRLRAVPAPDDAPSAPAGDAALTDPVADKPALHPFEAQLLGLDDAGETADQDEAAPLLLGEAERVSTDEPASAEDETPRSAKSRRSRWARIESPLSRRFTLIARPEAAPVEAEAPMPNSIADLPDAEAALPEDVATAAEQPLMPEPAPDPAYDLPMPAFAATAFSAPVFYQAEIVDTAFATPATAADEAEATATDDPEVLPAEAALNDASLRAVIREMIQEELHGELGQRFSRNLRAVIRREVAAAIDDQADRF